MLPPPTPACSLAPNQPLGSSLVWVRSVTGASLGSRGAAPWWDCEAHAAIPASLVGAWPACPLFPECGAHRGLDQAGPVPWGFAKDVNSGNMVRAFGHLCPGQGHWGVCPGARGSPKAGFSACSAWLWPNEGLAGMGPVSREPLGQCNVGRARCYQVRALWPWNVLL